MYIEEEKPQEGGYSEEAYCRVLYMKLIKNNRVLRFKYQNLQAQEEALWQK